MVVVETIDYRLHHHHRSFPPFARYCGHSAEKTLHSQPKRKKSCLFLKDGRRWERRKGMATPPPILVYFIFASILFIPLESERVTLPLPPPRLLVSLFLCHRSMCMYVTLSPEHTPCQLGRRTHYSTHTHWESGGSGSETIVCTVLVMIAS